MKIFLPSARQSSCQGGIALIVVMIAIFVLTIMAGAFAYSMKVETKLAMNANNDSDLEWLGRSGVEYTRWLLAQENCPYDSRNQIWAGGPGAPCETNGPLAGASLKGIVIGDGYVDLTIIDLERKINVNTADEAILNSVMRGVGADATQSGTIVDSILDWVDRDDNTRVNGAESDFYQGLTPPYVAKNGPIDDPSELLFIHGIRENPAIYSKKYDDQQSVDRFGNPLPSQQYTNHLEDVFTALSSGRVNINTADRDILAMIPGMDEAIADQIIRVRSGPDGVDGTDDDTPFASVGELASVGLPQAAAPSLNHYCTTKSSTFQVEVDAHIGGSEKKYRAIVGRNNPRDIQILSFYPE